MAGEEIKLRAWLVAFAKKRPRFGYKRAHAIAEEVAAALKQSEELFAEGTTVTLTNIAGARFVSQGDARILEGVAV